MQTIIPKRFLTFPTFVSIVKRDIVRNNANGQFFTVVFTTKAGKRRVMNCRLKVSAYLKGGASTTAHIDNLLTVWDRKSMQYRSISLDKIESITSNGNRMEFK